MHPVWQIPELLVQIISFLPASDIDRTFDISHHFRTTLKANLPPQLRSLPDPSPKKSNQVRTLPQKVRDKAAAFGTHDAALPAQLKMDDTTTSGEKKHEAKSSMLYYLIYTLCSASL
jgi:hypothetical protein